jgi:hypothetical protein
VLPGVIGLVQATEAIKVLVGIGEPLIGRLLTYDALGMRFREVKLRRDAKCPLCGTNPTITDLSIHAQGGAACAVSSGNGEPAAPESHEPAAAREPAGAGARVSAAGSASGWPEPASAAREPASGARQPASGAREPVSGGVRGDAPSEPPPVGRPGDDRGATAGARAEHVTTHTGC